MIPRRGEAEDLGRLFWEAGAGEGGGDPHPHPPPALKSPLPCLGGRCCSHLRGEGANNTLRNREQRPCRLRSSPFLLTQ